MGGVVRSLGGRRLAHVWQDSAGWWARPWHSAASLLVGPCPTLQAALDGVGVTLLAGHGLWGLTGLALRTYPSETVVSAS